MMLPTFYSLLVILVMERAASAASENQDDEISRWISGLRTLLKGCPPIPPRNNEQQQDFITVLRYCLQHRAVQAVDTLLTDDVIPILDGINLVRYDHPQSNTTGKENDRNQTYKIEDNETPKSGEGWPALVMNKLTRLLRTHVFKIELDQVLRSYELSANNYEEQEGEKETEGEIGEDLVHGRKRRHKRKGMMMPVMMMGFLFMGTILIPMGFQFLAVLGGKALILAKMALMLSSIQGLKKIATSGMNYGLYHSSGPDGWHDRSNHQEMNNKPPIPVELPYQIFPHGQFNSN